MKKITIQSSYAKDSMSLPNVEPSADKIVRHAKTLFPDAELYELGALFMSIGVFLTSNAVPEMWKDLKPTALLAHQLLNQKDHDPQGTEGSTR